MSYYDEYISSSSVDSEEERLLLNKYRNNKRISNMYDSFLKYLKTSEHKYQRTQHNLQEDKLPSSYQNPDSKNVQDGQNHQNEVHKKSEKQIQKYKEEQYEYMRKQKQRYKMYAFKKTFFYCYPDISTDNNYEENKLIEYTAKMSINNSRNKDDSQKYSIKSYLNYIEEKKRYDLKEVINEMNLKTIYDNLRNGFFPEKPIKTTSVDDMKDEANTFRCGYQYYLNPEKKKPRVLSYLEKQRRSEKHKQKVLDNIKKILSKSQNKNSAIVYYGKYAHYELKYKYYPIRKVSLSLYKKQKTQKSKEKTPRIPKGRNISDQLIKMANEALKYQKYNMFDMEVYNEDSNLKIIPKNKRIRYGIKSSSKKSRNASKSLNSSYFSERNITDTEKTPEKVENLPKKVAYSNNLKKGFNFFISKKYKIQKKRKTLYYKMLTCENAQETNEKYYKYEINIRQYYSDSLKYIWGYNIYQSSNFGSSIKIYKTEIKQFLYKIKYPENCEFIRKILKYQFKDMFQKISSNVTIKNSFEDYSDYSYTMSTLLLNYCISDLQIRMQRLFEKKAKPSLVSIYKIYKTTSGQIYMSLYFCVPTIYDKYENLNDYELKKLTLSQHRIGLLTNYNHFSSNFEYGVPCKNNKKLFSTICYIQSNRAQNQNFRKIKVFSYFYPSELYLILLGQQSREVNFFNLDKISSHFRYYTSIVNLKHSQLCPFILNPLECVRYRAYEEYSFSLNKISTVMSEKFNYSQFKAIQQITEKCSGLHLIQGPPGTGKTETLLGLVASHLEVSKNGNKKLVKIMICAPSNSVVDAITTKLVLGGVLGVYKRVWPKILRVGAGGGEDYILLGVNYDVVCAKEFARVKKLGDTQTATLKNKLNYLQSKLYKTSNYQYISKIKLQIRYIDSKLNSAFGYNSFLNNRRNILKYIEQRVLLYAEIILTTINSSGSDRLDMIRDKISLLIIDEAAQATETSIIIPLQTGATKVVLIGDPKQLPATVLSQDNSTTNFNRSLFYRLVFSGVTPYFLNIQYRMDPLIREFPSKKFYDGKLLDGPNVEDRKNNNIVVPQTLQSFMNRSVIFVGVEYQEYCFYNNSYSNSAEAYIVSYIVREYFFMKDCNIGIITPYQTQKKKIDGLLRDPGIMVNTVDSFQGQEKDVVIVSTVRSNDRGSIGFLSDYRRTNVTITRSKHLLIVVGNPRTLSTNKTWFEFIQFVRKNNLCYYIKSKDVQKYTMDRIMRNSTQRSDYLQAILLPPRSKEYYKKKYKRQYIRKPKIVPVLQIIAPQYKVQSYMAEDSESEKGRYAFLKKQMYLYLESYSPKRKSKSKSKSKPKQGRGLKNSLQKLRESNIYISKPKLIIQEPNKKNDEKASTTYVSSFGIHFYNKNMDFRVDDDYY